MGWVYFHLLKEKVVAFDIRLKSTVNLATNGRVVFATVDLNEGNGYVPSNGIFIAPAAGVYIYDWTRKTQNEKLLTLHSSLKVKESGIIAMILTASKTYQACSK